MDLKVGGRNIQNKKRSKEGNKILTRERSWDILAKLYMCMKQPKEQIKATL